MNPSPQPGPLRPFLDRQGVMILDGGLATALEARSADLSGRLWSARLLLDDPALIQAVHLDFLEAGADCIISASYQATAERFLEEGLSREVAEALPVRAVQLAVAVRDRFWTRERSRSDRLRPLVAASVGPYGAYLADGSEYTGDYGLDEAELFRFHEDRWSRLASSGADLLACETIPSSAETAALCALLARNPGPGAWFSFSCRDATRLRDGSSLAEAVRRVSRVEGALGVGVNCVDPRIVTGLIGTVRSASDLPVVVYPNSGELWDASRRAWTGDPAGFPAAEWVQAGASVIGGCCRVGPDAIRRLRNGLLAGPSG